MVWQASYFDGTSAKLIKVKVSIGANELLVQTIEDGNRVAWPFGDIELISSGSDGARVELGCDSLPSARLRLEGPAILEELQERIPRLGKTDWRGGAKLTGLISAGLGLLLAILYFLPVLIVPIIPDSYARHLGDSVSSQILISFGGACGGEDGADVLDQLAAKLTPEDTDGFRIRVDVVNSPVVNAVALPGGRIIFFRGLIDKAESADEVAGVLAHEIGHVAHRHGLENMARTLGFQVVLGALVGGTTGETGQMMLSMSFSRDAEREADRMAIDMLSGAGISAEGFAAFFDRIGGNKKPGEDEHQGDEGRGFFDLAGTLVSSHPASPERATLAREQNLPQSRPALDAEEWNALQSICTVGDEDVF